MDLYRVLRISIYLLVASGAFAICVAEGSPAFLIGVFAFGGLAYLTVDSRRMKPVRVEFASAMALALLIYTLLPLREDTAWDRFPAAFAHFLCALEVLLFFTAFRGPMLFLFCGATLAVVVISGIMQPSITLLGRLICFTTVTSWTLFIHSLWRARESFQRRTTTESTETRSSEKVLSERAFWQELALTGAMSAACLIIGIMLYFTAPRLEQLGSFFHPSGPTPIPKGPGPNGDGIAGQGGPEPTVPVHTGEGQEISLKLTEDIIQSNGTAFSVKFSGRMADLADGNGRLLFKTGAFGEFRDGYWIEIPTSLVKDTEKILDPSLSGAIYRGAEIKESIHNESAGIHVLGVAGAISRVANVTAQPGPTPTLIDAEGSLSIAKNEQLAQADVWVTLPPRESQLDKNSAAIHDNISRYVLNTGLGGSEAALRKEAIRITAKCEPENYLAKIHAIIEYLRSPRFSYTMKLKGLIPSDQPLERFLLNPNPDQRRGHCALFAGAFVQLCRLNNIPARLAKGYAKELPKKGNNEIWFKFSEAHSWGEVYFKGVGWVAFDPTPHDPNAVPPPDEPPHEPIVGGAGPTPTNGSTGFIDSNWKWFMDFNSGDQRKAIEWVSSEFSGSGTALGSSMGWLESLIAWSIVLLILGAIVYLFLKRGGRRLPMIFTGPRKARAAVAFYNDLLQVLSRRGYVRRPGQTPREFAEFVVKRGGASFQPVMVVTEIFESVRYGNVDVSQEEFNALQKSLDNLRDLTFGAKS